MTKVSVIVPVYNTSKYLKTCIDSILNQTFKDIEIILVNDGSTDNSLDILLEYKWNYPDKIKVLSGPNKGAGKARNMAIDIAKGEYIMFVDSDDYITLDAIEKAYKCAINNSSDLVVYDFNRIIGKVQFNYRVLDSTLDKNEKNIKLNDDDYLYKETAGSCNKFFSRKLIGNTRFPSKILFEDFPFTNSMLFKAENIVYLKENLYKYRFNPRSTMGANLFHVNNRIMDCLNACDILDESITDKKGLNDMIKSLEKIWCIHIFNDLILWKEITIKEKQMLYSYFIKIIELKYGDIESDYVFNLTRNQDSFFKKRMEFMKKYFIKDEYKQTDSIEELKNKSLELINRGI